MSSIGIKLPITYDTGDGFTMITTIREMVKQNLKRFVILLKTKDGIKNDTTR